MTQHHLVFLVALVLLTVFLLYRLYFYVRRRKSKTIFRNKYETLFGINPRKKRLTLYETASLKIQKLSWLTAINRKYNEEGVKEFGEFLGIDNSSDYVDTFGVRNSIHRETAVQRLMVGARSKLKSMTDGISVALVKLNARARRAIKAIPYFINYLIRSLVRRSIKTGGDGENEDSNSRSKH